MLRGGGALGMPRGVWLGGFRKSAGLEMEGTGTERWFVCVWGGRRSEAMLAGELPCSRCSRC